MRLIDADALIEEYDRVHVGEPGGARKLMMDAPTVEERKTGKWLSHYEYCKKHKLLPSGLVAFWWCDQCEQGVEHPTNFCPNCGSYNGGEQDEYNH